MFSSYGKVALAASWLLLRIANAEAAPDPSPKPNPNPVPQQIATATTTPAMNALTPVGCYATPEPMVDHGPWTFQSKGNCQPICYELQMPVMGLVNGTNCWCGALIPPEDSLVDNSSCSTPCGGIDTEMCGGDNFWTVYLTGITRNKIAHLDPASVSGTAGSPTKTASSSAKGPATVVVTASSDPQKPKSSGGGTSKVGVAVGVVVGVVAVLGIIAGVFFFLRHKRRRDAEEEYKRQAAVNAFVNGGKGHNSTPSLNDSRLDPELLQRRESTGTIADNQDYSRRILKVSLEYSFRLEY
jgi:cell wall integrity and stress response component